MPQQFLREKLQPMQDLYSAMVRFRVLCTLQCNPVYYLKFELVLNLLKFKKI